MINFLFKKLGLMRRRECFLTVEEVRELTDGDDVVTTGLLKIAAENLRRDSKMIYPWAEQDQEAREETD